MKLKSIFSICFLLIAQHVFSQAAKDLKTGDIIFQSSHSKAAVAIELATHSKFSHVGIIVKDNGKVYVLEAVQPVSITTFEVFINRGDKKYYEIKRLKNASEKITPALQQMMITKGKELKGLNYDYAFDWSDKELYCSELVYKIYKEVLNTELAKPRTLKTFDLGSAYVKQELTIRYGDKIPYNELMISPQQIYESSLLVEVK